MIKVIINNSSSVSEYPKQCKCRICCSILEIEENDRIRELFHYSQRECEVVWGFKCPCCDRFTPEEAAPVKIEKQNLND